MTIAKIEFPSKKYFKKLKESIGEINYIECGLCGAIRIDMKDLAPILESLISEYEDDNKYFMDLCSDMLSKITEPEFYDYENEENYAFLDEVIIFCDVNCNCFGKQKIKTEVIID